MKLSELKPNPKNPRDIDEKELEMLKKSLDKFGDLSGFVVNKVTGNIVSGHQRKKVLPSDSEIVITEQYEKPNAKGTIAIGYVVVDGEKHKYREVLFDEATEKAANIAANQQGGNFNLPALKEWVMELDELSIDLDLLGFKDDFLQTLIAPIHQANGDEDAVPEVPKEPKTKLGDLYKLGEHRLLCGDSTNIQHVERLMNGENADMVFTDPPYGMNLDTNTKDIYFKDQKPDKDGKYLSKTSSIGARKTNNYRPIIGDDTEFNSGIILGIFDYCKEVFLWGADYYCQSLPKKGSWLVWDKTGGNESLDKAGFQSKFELCWSKNSHRRSIVRSTWVGVSGMSHKDASHRMHPTQKPVKLCENIIKEYSEENKNIVDIYGGSGSTLIACEKTNRKCFMMELDPHYVDVIIKRFIQYANKPVFRINDDGIETDITAEFFI